MPDIPSHDTLDRQPDHDSIAFRAAQLWQQAGSPPDRDLEFWLGAEQELKAALGQPPGGAPTAADGTPAAVKPAGKPKAGPAVRAVRAR